MSVSEVANGQRVLPNHVYVIPPNADLAIQQGFLMIQPRQQIDPLLDSAILSLALRQLSGQAQAWPWT